jgi:hypothetical protein
MKTLAKQIEERMHGDWSMIREDHLERIWPFTGSFTGGIDGFAD